MTTRKLNKLFLQAAPLMLAILALVLIVASQGTAQAANLAKKGPATAAIPGAPTTTDKIAPQFKSGNVTCSTAGERAANGTLEFRVEGPGSFPYNNGQLFVTILKYADTNGYGEVFDWQVTAGGAVTLVLVKGGPNANAFVYPAPDLGDTGLHAPVNPKNQKYYGLSHISFCYSPAASIHGTKLEDRNGNGNIAEDSAHHLKDWSINLYADANGNGILEDADDGVVDSKYTPKATTQTGANGDYRFEGLNPGSYIVCEVLQKGWQQTYPVAGSGNCIGGFLASQGHHVQVAAGKTYQDRDFGNTRLYAKIVLTCDQTNDKLVASKSVMGQTTLTTATVGTGVSALTLGGNSISALELERFLCTQLGGVRFTNLAAGIYTQVETIPATFTP